MTISGPGGDSHWHMLRWRAVSCRPAVSAAATACWALAGWGLGAWVRRVSVRTGVSDAEAFGSLPGDEFIVHPMVEWTRGVTVRAAAERVWPWLVQMGYGRGGWYTPELVGLFANRWVFGVRQPFPASANRLLPEHQHVAVGDLICDGPGYASYFRVVRVDPEHALVYRSIRHPRRGSPIDITDPASPRRVEQQLREAGTYGHGGTPWLRAGRPARARIPIAGRFPRRSPGRRAISASAAASSGPARAWTPTAPWPCHGRAGPGHAVRHPDHEQVDQTDEHESRA